MAARMNSKGKTVPPRAPKSYSDSINTQQTLLGCQFKKIMNSQQRKFRVMNIHCDQMQKSMEILEKTIAHLQQRLQSFLQAKSSDSLQNLKDQQNSFIIQELNIKIKKQQRREVDLLEQSKKLKMENTRLKEDLQKLETNAKQKTKKDEAQKKNLKEELKQKTNAISELNRKISGLNIDQSKNINTFNPAITLPPKYPSHSDRMSQKQFADLENKLKQIELLMSQQIESLKERNGVLEQSLKKINEDKERSDAKNNALVYQLQIRLKQYKKMNKQLQDSYNALLAKSSENQISLHQQIMALKKSVNDEKKMHKALKKDIQNGIQEMVKILLPKNLIFQSNKLQQQLKQIAKQVQKVSKRSLQSLKVLHNDQIQRLKQQIDQKEKSLQIQILTRRKTQKSFTNISHTISQGSSNQNNLNNSANQSSEKGEFSQQDKFKVKFQNMKKQLKQKQTRIYEIQEQMDQQFSQSTEKILSMEQQFLSKNNQCRRKDQTIRDLNADIIELKKKLQMSEKLKQEIKVQYEANKTNLQANWKEKHSKLETLSLGYKTALKESEQRQQQMTSKYNKMKAKMDRIENETADSIKNKTERIDQLTKKNQQLTIQLKLANEKLKLEDILKVRSTQQNESPKKSNLNTPVNKDLIQQIQMERDRILQEYQTKKKQLNNAENDKNALNKKIKTLQQNLEDQKAASAKVKAKYENLKNQFETVKVQLKGKLQISEKEHQSSFVKLKKQYQKISNALKSSENNLQRKRKDYEQAVKSRQKYKKEAQNFKGQLDKLSNKNNQTEHNTQNSLKQKDQTIRNKDLKISQQNIQIKELMRILDYRNNNLDESSLRQSRKQSVKEDHVLKKLIAPQVAQIGINTDFQRQEINMSKIKKNPKRLVSQAVLEECEEDQDHKIEKKKEQKAEEIPATVFKNDNLFINLENQELDTDENFQICEEGQQINIGQTQQNLKIKEIFNRLRLQIQKIFNGEDPSMSILKILPFQLEDDYSEFITYVRYKMDQMRNMNHISFIGVVIGDQPDVSETSLDLPDLMQQGSQNTYKKLIFEKEQIINSLMAQKTEQQNTINQLTMQKEEVEQENQNRFMNQCNIYKKQIKEHKKMVDILEMNYQSMKNLLKNIFEIWVSQDDSEQDLRDNLQLYAKVTKLSDKERSRLNFYIMKYKQIKGIS